MKKVKKIYTCNSCGAEFPKWSGQCTSCGEWDTITEEIQEKESKASIVSALNIDPKRALEAEDITASFEDISRIASPFNELNRVLGGGIVPGSVILIGGDPGIGKSTILLQLSMLLSKSSSNCFYVTGEESTNQVKLRADRLNIDNSKLKLLSATNVNNILATIQEMKDLDLVIIDSIQTIYSEDFSSTPGTVTQIRQCTQLLLNFAKKNNVALIIVGHVTKEGELAGPKILEHMVDTVLYLEGDQNNQYRILRSVKNRFGGVNEIGVFEMTSFGMKEVSNPSELFLMERESNVSGTSVFAGIEGTRPLLVEIQALISPSFIPTPRRSAVGWDQNRLSMIIAVLGVRYGLNLSNKDVYLSVTGGLKINEPAADLAVAAAIISAAYDKPLPDNSVFFGEIGLSGEVRKVNLPDIRANEVIKQGFSKIYSGNKINNNEQKTISIKHISQLKSIFS